MFKRGLGLTLACALAIGASTGITALATDNATSGGVEISNEQITPFKSQNVGGGTWDYGTRIVGSKKEVYSNYFHPSKSHKSSCSIGSNFSDSGWVSAKKTSYSSARGGYSAKTHAYWDVR